jgi:adenylate kinase
MIRVILFGAPGCGKGTQANFIESEFGFTKISTGDLIRAEIKTESTIGKKAKAVIDRGELVSDKIIVEMVKKRVGKNDINNGYVMDGFPRTVNQANELSKIYIDKEFAIHLVIDGGVILDRLLFRLTCKECSAIFNQKTKLPKKERICDICGAKLENRADDNEETIKNRLLVYKHETLPVINYYENKSRLYEVNANDIGINVFGKIKGIIK